MKNVIENLERFYKSFVDQKKDWPFFTNLSDYLNYISEMPDLQKIVSGIMKKKHIEDNKLEELERNAIGELEFIKGKILKIVKDCKIDPNKIKSLHTIPIPEYNILEDLGRFEDGRIHISDFRSDALWNYLLDIAIGISEQGHKQKVLEFMVSNKEYADFYNAPDSGLRTAGNPYGNFIFSKTIKQRREQHEFIENAAKFELWGIFNELIKFQTAYNERRKNKSLGEISREQHAKAKNYMEDMDAVYITFMAEGLNEIIKAEENKNNIRSIYTINLEKERFINYAEKAHNYLMKELNTKEIAEDKQPKKEICISIDDGVYKLKGGKKINYPISGKRAKLINHLKDGKKDGNLLCRLFDWDLSQLSKEIKQINELFKDKLDLKDDLIIHIDTGGYALNKDVYLIKFIA